MLAVIILSNNTFIITQFPTTASNSGGTTEEAVSDTGVARSKERF